MILMIPLRDSVPSRRVPFITYLLIVTNVLVFIFTKTLSNTQLHLLVFHFGFIPARLSSLLLYDSSVVITEALLPMVSSLFIHGSWFHLISNMWSLWLFGDNVEDNVGHIKYFLFYLLAGIFASFIHFIFNASSPIPVIGASGAISAVMGAYVVMFPFARITTLIPLLWIPFFIKVPAIFFMGIWFFSQITSGISTLIHTDLGGGIAWWAHIGGFIFGIFIINFIRTKSWRYRCSPYDEHYDCYDDSDR